MAENLDPIQQQCRKLIRSDKADSLSDEDFLLVAGLAESDEDEEPIDRAVIARMVRRFSDGIGKG